MCTQGLTARCDASQLQLPYRTPRRHFKKLAFWASLLEILTLYLWGGTGHLMVLMGTKVRKHGH